MLRITDMAGSEYPSLKVEGRIDDGQIEELSSAVDRVRTASSRVLLDMSGVTFVNRAGVELLLVLRAQGVELLNCSTFIETLVSGESK